MIIPAISFTPEGGLAVRLINKTGSSSVRGEIVGGGGSTFKGFVQAGAGSDMPIGTVYDAGVADGSPCRVVVAGVGYVLMKDSTATTEGYVLHVSATVAGRAEASSTIPSSTNHWREIGHCLEANAGGTNQVIQAVLHFN